MDAGVTAAVWSLDAAFVAHPVPEVLTGCAHCHGEVHVRDADPVALALGLGETLGGPEDVRALTPWLLRRTLVDDRLDLHTVLSRIAQYWRDWTVIEREAVRDFVDALWSAVLDVHPDAPDGVTAVAFLDGAGGLRDDPARLLGTWEYKDLPSADHHLAEIVVDAFYGARVDLRIADWAYAPAQQARLRHALDRDRGERWAGTLSAACELLPA